MSPEPQQPQAQPQPAPAEDPILTLGPPEEDPFWERYNRRLEFPLAAVGAILAHVLVAAFLIMLFLGIIGGSDDKGGVPVQLVEGGMDDSGEGSAGSGGIEEPLLKPNPEDIFKQFEPASTVPDLPMAQPDPSTLPELTDPTTGLPVPKNTKPPTGAEKGAGPGQGRGFDGTPGKGPGGGGADSTRARSLRWILRFKTRSGEDYVEQIAAMGGVILVPITPDNKKCILVEDLRNPSGKRMATDDDMRKLSGRLKFNDNRPESVKAVLETLGVRENARTFWVLFPKNLEDELAKKETGYRGRRAEDIEETIFSVTVRGGGYEFVVVDQSIKK